MAELKQLGFLKKVLHTVRLEIHTRALLPTRSLHTGLSYYTDDTFKRESFSNATNDAEQSWLWIFFVNAFSFKVRVFQINIQRSRATQNRIEPGLIVAYEEEDYSRKKKSFAIDFIESSRTQNKNLPQNAKRVF